MKSLEKLDQQIAQAIIQACDEILDGNLRDQFIVDAIQGGAGTSANMNANEVIANRAIEILGGTKGDYSIVHPNDHVNMSQSTNDVIPTAGKITVLKLLPQTIKELEKLEKAMEEKEAEFDDILKMGRTQLQDAVPMRLGQSFGAFAHVLKRDIKRLKNVMDEMKVLNIGAQNSHRIIRETKCREVKCYQCYDEPGISNRIRCQRNNDRSCIQGNGTSAIRTSSYDRYPGT